MKKLLILFSTVFLNWSCTDDCTQTRTYRTTIPISIGQEQLKNSITTKEPQDLVNPSKIYAYENYLIICETKKGLHIIDNSNPSSPLKLSFLNIPGVIDMAVKDNILYVDNYTDLVALDISNPKSITEVGRLKNMFNNGMVDGISWYFDPYSKIITDYELKTVTETVKTNCGQNGTVWPVFRGGMLEDRAYNSSSGPTGTTGTSGKGGSMARFTIHEDYLYAVTQSDLMVFNIKVGQKPDSVNTVKMGWGIETIFPYKDKLFVGSNTGMYIFDNSNPASPERLSIFQHARACDPVVVENDKAYVTLRSGWCGASPNQMDIIDVNNLSSPFLIKSYQMQNPHGLSVLNSKLTLCEGEFGLKTYDVKDAMDIKLQQHIKDINAFDVIQLDASHLLMIGKDGLYQYDNSDPKNLKLLSKIEVKR
ncbi:hypothetical protein EGI22_17025 [Lacihabitans sp. LS3-19]|uniref:LVIVD repeat-containing protein n=1 Tax=Lacihabitans sp. LS3-19 TaxID=2487335 RepID=UPI0020CF12FE|nr:hypothetical protein [Lacihabitans sp. LS3-19]MCP9769608.1 hypothetical protein [Lacihabitans sp. LS3-19]